MFIIMKFLSRYTISLLFCCLLITTISFAGKVASAPQESQKIKLTTLKDFVNSATQYVKQEGLLEACKEFNNSQGKFSKGGLYIFVVEYTGKVLAHGGDASIVGTNISSLQDEFGSPLLLMYVDAAKNGGGNVGYYWKDYTKKGTILFKTAYIKPLDNKTFIGAGYYENK